MSSSYEKMATDSLSKAPRRRIWSNQCESSIGPSPLRKSAEPRTDTTAVVGTVRNSTARPAVNSLEPYFSLPSHLLIHKSYCHVCEGKAHMKTMEDVSSAQLVNDRKPEEYDLVILGGGTGSTIAAWTLASQGQRVAVIDRKYIGGSCPNIACLPSKNIIHSAKVASYFRRSEEFGIAKRDFTVDMTAVRGRKRRMVSGWNNVYLENYKQSGAEFILGSGRFIGPKTVEVTLHDGTIRQL